MKTYLVSVTTVVTVKSPGYGNAAEDTANTIRYAFDENPYTTNVTITEVRARIQEDPPKGECPTACDDDCDACCHEWHKVKNKRLHQPKDCPGRRKQ